jgi:hypothetical protein
MRKLLLELERREGRKTIRTLPVLRRQVAHRSRAGFLAPRSQHYRREPFHLPQRSSLLAIKAEWDYETVYLVTVAGPRWDFTSFPIKPPLWGT